MRYPLTVISRATPYERAEIAMRSHLCSHCPYRSRDKEWSGIDSPRACESRCPFFQELPRLVQAARYLDPMVGRLHRVMDARLREVCRRLPRSAEGRRAFLLMHRQQIIDDLAKITAH